MDVEPRAILLLVVLILSFVISRRFWDGLLFFALGRFFAVFCVHVFTRVCVYSIGVILLDPQSRLVLFG